MNIFEKFSNLGNMQEQINKAQEKLSQTLVTGSAGGNMVTVTLNGRFEMTDIKLDPLCVDNRDIPMLQDLIVAAYRDAMDKLSVELRDSVIGGLKI